MTSLERVLAALNHELPDRAPRLLYGEALDYVPAIKKMLQDYCGSIPPGDYFDMDIRGVDLNPTRLSTERFDRWFPEGPSGVPANVRNQDGGAEKLIMDEWGVCRRGSGFEHLVHIESPLKDKTDFACIKEYPWPDLDEHYRFADLGERVDAFHAAGRAVAGFPGMVFEQAWYIRGFEILFQDMALNPEMAHFLLDRTAYYQRAVAVAFARAGVDIVMLGDDVAHQTGLMMSVSMWREFLKERLKGTIEAVKEVRPETRIFYHSDGNIEPLIPDLIDAGVDVLNPVQPECMDPALIKEKYGDKLTFWGTVSVQKTMPFGTPEDVRREVRLRLRTVGRDGGLILAPAHVLQPEVPLENIKAFFEAADGNHGTE